MLDRKSSTLLFVTRVVEMRNDVFIVDKYKRQNGKEQVYLCFVSDSERVIKIKTCSLSVHELRMCQRNSTWFISVNLLVCHRALYFFFHGQNSAVIFWFYVDWGKKKVYLCFVSDPQEASKCKWEIALKISKRYIICYIKVEKNKKGIGQ